MAADHIPVIDISNIDQETGNRLVEAIHRWGFAFVKGSNTGFTASLIDHTFELSKAFFQAPQEEKQPYAISADNKGWSSMHLETLDPGNQKKGDLKEAFNIGEFASGKAQQPMPNALAAHESDICEFANRCRALCLQLLGLLALGLRIDPKEGGQAWFAGRHDTSRQASGSILRLLYYPSQGVCPPELRTATDIRAGAHSDYGSLTLLFQRSSQPGLEIRGPKADWSSVPVWPKDTEADSFPPVLVNVGDLLSYWNNGFLKSTVHRVVIPPDGRASDRYSMAYFCHPTNQTRLTPIPSDLFTHAFVPAATTNEGFANPSELTAEEHLKSRLAATYGWEKSTEIV